MDRPARTGYPLEVDEKDRSARNSRPSEAHEMGRFARNHHPEQANVAHDVKDSGMRLVLLLELLNHLQKNIIPFPLVLKRSIILSQFAGSSGLDVRVGIDPVVLHGVGLSVMSELPCS